MSTRFPPARCLLTVYSLYVISTIFITLVLKKSTFHFESKKVMYTCIHEGRRRWRTTNTDKVTKWWWKKYSDTETGRRFEQLSFSKQTFWVPIVVNRYWLSTLKSLFLAVKNAAMVKIDWEIKDVKCRQVCMLPNKWNYLRMGNLERQLEHMQAKHDGLSIDINRLRR